MARSRHQPELGGAHAADGLIAAEAAAYRADLDLDGVTAWLLPTKGELRGPIRGCAGPVVGAAAASTEVEDAMGGTSYWSALYEDDSPRQSLDISLATNHARCVY